MFNLVIPFRLAPSAIEPFAEFGWAPRSASPLVSDWNLGPASQFQTGAPYKFHPGKAVPKRSTE